MKKIILSVFLFLGCLLTSFAQPEIDFPKDYFRSPVDIPIELAGGFAECRPNHFHTGLDIKTQQRENMGIFAAADGYVSRISIAHSGYGNCLYITHPNGYTTVYGHLNDFEEKIQKYTVDKQYELESWDIDIHLSVGELPVKKGEFIAFSGNTGGSTGPHLHFEVRESESGEVLNGYLFGFPIQDTKPPIAKGISIYDAGQNSFGQDPILITPEREQVLNLPFKKIKIGIQAQDYTDNSLNWLGIYEMKLFQNDQLQFFSHLSRINFSQNRYVNAYADYKLYENKKVWYQNLYRLPNNKLDVYPFVNDDNGILDISDGNIHDLLIELYDPFGNKSKVNLKARYRHESDQSTFLCQGEYWAHSKSESFKTSSIQLQSGINSFYDDICLVVNENESGKYFSSEFQIANADIPIHEPLMLKMRLNKLLPLNLRSKLVFVHHIKAASLPGRNPQKAMAATFDQGWAKANIRTFGNYYVDIDTIPPMITNPDLNKNQSSSTHISFTVKENLTSIKNFRAELNGQWLRFVRRGNTFTYTFDKYCPAGENKLIVEISDQNNNSKVYNFDFIR